MGEALAIHSAPVAMPISQAICADTLHYAAGANVPRPHSVKARKRKIISMLMTVTRGSQ
jgi:hypothetical protein